MRFNKGLNTFLFLYLILFIIGLLVLPVIQKGDVLLWINKNHNPFGNYFFRYATFIGDGIVFALVVILFLFINFRWALLLLAGFITSGLGVQFLKQIIFPDYARPLKYFNHLDLNIIEGVANRYMHSFPSGHTSTAFALMCLIAFYFGSRRLAVVFLALAFIVATSRIYLVQHFFIDTLFGSLFGVICAVLCIVFIFNNPKLEAKKWAAKSFRRDK